jgi:hypothetical protein
MDRKRIGTFLLGGLAGVLAGILIAPRSGRELRGTIANRTGEARERSRETVFDAQERVAERLSERSARPQIPRRAPEPTLGHSSEPGHSSGPNDPHEPAPERERPRLRDVSRDVVPPPGSASGEAPATPHDAAREQDEDERAEELRRKVQETRERLRARLEDPGEQ